MTQTLKLLLCLSLLCGWHARAAAQVAVTSSSRTGAATLTLEQALRRSLRYNPEIA